MAEISTTAPEESKETTCVAQVATSLDIFYPLPKAAEKWSSADLFASELDDTFYEMANQQEACTQVVPADHIDYDIPWPTTDHTWATWLSNILFTLLRLLINVPRRSIMVCILLLATLLTTPSSPHAFLDAFYSDPTTILDDSSIWVVDTGATSHLSNDTSWLQDQRAASDIYVRTAGSQSIKSNIIGKAVIPIHNNGVLVKHLDALACRFVPGLRKNLFSICQYTNDTHHEVTFYKDRAVSRGQKGEIFWEARLVKGLYLLPTNSLPIDMYLAEIKPGYPTTALSVELWHR
jgi:hypothetical protein